MEVSDVFNEWRYSKPHVLFLDELAEGIADLTGAGIFPREQVERMLKQRGVDDPQDVALEVELRVRTKKIR